MKVIESFVLQREGQGPLESARPMWEIILKRINAISIPTNVR